MGDELMSPGSDLPVVSGVHPGPTALDAQHPHTPIATDDIPSAYSQQSYIHSPQLPNNNFEMAQPHGPVRSGPYNMTALAQALPQGNYRQGHFNPAQMRYNPSGSSPNNMGQGQPLPLYGGQPPMGNVPNQSYYMQQHQQPYYGSPMPSSQQQQQHQQQNMSPRPNIPPYYSNQVMPNHQAHPQMAYYYAQMPSYPPQGQHGHQGMPGSYMPNAGAQHDPRLGPQMGDVAEHNSFSPTGQNSRRSPADSQSNVVRGPPRKPRQSGHAIWIGNLPSQTDLMSLVNHVCKEAEGLESLFLISKSNCAFANYKDEATCLAAQQKLHESKFQSVRLVSRLRKNTVEGASGVTAPTGPAAASMQQQQQPVTGDVKESVTTEATEIDASASENTTPSVAIFPETKAPVVVDVAAQKDKFFVLKSLTLEDLELSVRTGIWATQSHNEEALNAAFKTSENVYLVFSANKSGEYFGYARMVSTINEDPAAAIEFAPKAPAVSEVDLPREIPTEANETTPKGRIIDDSARGTIFWEVVRDDGQEGEEASYVVTSEQDDAASSLDGGPESKTWGKPFKLEWLCTTRLPFYRCRGLRNPWNSNREVKIARDGTELEPTVGRRLIGLFNRNHNSPVSRGPMMGMAQMMPQQGMGYPASYA